MLRSFSAISLLLLAGCGAPKGPDARPQGSAETPKTEVLQAGSRLLQRDEPLESMDVYVAGLHPMKNNPGHQMEAHHFCRQVNQDFAQCALFDGNTRNANLTGIEYIISEKLFDKLPAEERRLWHPHNYEILSGQLQAPGIPGPAEKELMRDKMNSYGKTWHTWMTNHGHTLPLGEATLAWSFNADGEANPDLVSRFEQRHSKLADKRRDRQDLTRLAKPQEGVSDLQGKFGRPTQTLPGVVDRKR
jgi:hypothetical protein